MSFPIQNSYISPNEEIHQAQSPVQETHTSLRSRISRIAYNIFFNCFGCLRAFLGCLKAKIIKLLFPSSPQKQPDPPISPKAQCPLLETIDHNARNIIFSHPSYQELLSVTKTCKTLHEEVPQPLLDRFGILPLTTENRKYCCKRITTILDSLTNGKVLNDKEKAFFSTFSADTLFENFNNPKASAKDRNTLYILLDAAYNCSLVAPFLEDISPNFPENAPLSQKVKCARNYIEISKDMITELVYTSGDMTCFPEELCESLPKLTALQLDDNQLTHLPNAIEKLINLQLLSLGNNQLTNLPDVIGKLVNLKILSLNNNQLIKLPDAIGKLPIYQTLLESLSI